jgi:hypothetical protein
LTDFPLKLAKVRNSRCLMIRFERDSRNICLSLTRSLIRSFFLRGIFFWLRCTRCAERVCIKEKIKYNYIFVSLECFYPWMSLSTSWELAFFFVIHLDIDWTEEKKASVCGVVLFFFPDLSTRGLIFLLLREVRWTYHLFLFLISWLHTRLHFFSYSCSMLVKSGKQKNFHLWIDELRPVCLENFWTSYLVLGSLW